MSKFKAEYVSNNSGGSWWLNDSDWKNLESSGWNVKWFSEGHGDPLIKGDRFLGALATSAVIELDADNRASALKKAIFLFEEATKQDYRAEGCSCCGEPHYIYVAEVK